MPDIGNPDTKTEPHNRQLQEFLAPAGTLFWPGVACQQTEKNVKETVAEAGVDAKVDKVTNLLEIAKYGVFGTPAVVVDGQVKCVGKIPTKDEIKKWILK